MKKQILQFSALILLALTFSASKTEAQYWKLTGNAGTDSNTNYLGTTDNRPLIFRTKAVERMRIQGGRIGIGTAHPTAKLNVYDDVYATLTTPGILMLGKVGTYNMALDNYSIQARNNGSAADLYLNQYGGTVYGGNNADSYYGLVGSGKYEGTYGYTNDSSGIGAYGYSSYYYGVYGYTGGGLGTGDPYYSAGVYGYNASFGDGVTGHCVQGSGVLGYSDNYIGVYGVGASGSYAGFFAGDVYTTGSYLPSDAKLKQNVKDLTSAMDIIDKLHPKQYEYRQDGNYKLMKLPTGNRFGLIAEDVEKVLPELVKQSKFNTKDVQQPRAVDPKDRSVKQVAVQNETIDFKALNYTELIPVIIKGMQEQQSIINQQQEQINQLKELVQNMAASNSSDAKAALIETGAYLIQNAPNPFSENTMVKCYVPFSVKQAQLAVYNINGQLLKTYTLTGGMNNITINAGTLASGQYSYSLVVNSKKIDTKNMIITN